ARLEQLELQAAAEAGLVDVLQQRVHLGAVGPLLDQRAELSVALGVPRTTGVEVDRLPLLRYPLVTKLVIPHLALYQGLVLLAPVEPPERRQGGEQQADEDRDPRRQRPHAGIVRIEVLKILRQALEVDRRQLALRVRGLLHLRATLSCPAATAGLSSC